jgi:hypothetical protein
MKPAVPPTNGCAQQSGLSRDFGKRAPPRRRHRYTMAQSKMVGGIVTCDIHMDALLAHHIAQMGDHERE